MTGSSPLPPGPGRELDLLVRDYECDMQGIVNHAVYLHYLEHARHQFLQSIGLDFDTLTRAKIFLVVIRAEIDYKLPLRSRDRFRVLSGLVRVSPLRFAFRQEIRRRGDDRLNVSARIVCTAVNERGRPFLPGEIAALLDAG
ncbi:MAG TPA: acyl-CoA thioesterase [Candidatus Aminicenantes bacterium]|nr:acyl-CoA thioesterase [Candidatus Aminicenantes bacterium]